VDHFENLRQQLRSAQNSETNSIRSGKIKDVADAIEAYAGRRRPAYQAALDTYRSDSNYADAFAHGRQGGDRTNIDNPRLQAALRTPEGNAGYAHGSAEKTAADNLSDIAPGNIKPAQGAMTPAQITQLAVSAAHPSSPWSIAHMVRAIPGMRVSDEGQRQMVRLLTNPRSAPQALNLLRQRGAAQADIDRISQAIAGASGVTAAKTVGD
jgi:hypothetical protein